MLVTLKNGFGAGFNLVEFIYVNLTLVVSKVTKKGCQLALTPSPKVLANQGAKRSQV